MSLDNDQSDKVVVTSLYTNLSGSITAVRNVIKPTFDFGVLKIEPDGKLIFDDADEAAKALHKAWLRLTRPEVDRTTLAKRMAESVDVVWDELSDTPDIASGHNVPEGCKQYWLNLADVVIVPYT